MKSVFVILFLFIFFWGGGWLFLRIAGKIAKIVQIRTRKKFVPHGISRLSERFLFCWQLVSIFEENNLKNRPVRRREASAHLKFFFNRVGTGYFLKINSQKEKPVSPCVVNTVRPFFTISQTGFLSQLQSSQYNGSLTH